MPRRYQHAQAAVRPHAAMADGLRLLLGWQLRGRSLFDTGISIAH
jgi:hypothetical protein